ncbi:hypothetical protein EZE58_01200 [Brevibacterium sp. LS14]|uniref:hypothetical protein n=1 Tax=Brevibacterium sp. LS14 TaxID=2528962 RepID=UPI0014320F3E|nr:hypothetical protein [Brevibacterium sp. LS14]
MQEIEPYAIEAITIDRDFKDIDRFTADQEYCVHVKTSRAFYNVEQRQLWAAFNGLAKDGDLMNGLRFTSKGLQFWSTGDMRTVEFVKRVHAAADELAEATAKAFSNAERRLGRLEGDLQQYVTE